MRNLKQFILAVKGHGIHVASVGVFDVRHRFCWMRVYDPVRSHSEGQNLLNLTLSKPNRESQHHSVHILKLDETQVGCAMSKRTDDTVFIIYLL